MNLIRIELHKLLPYRTTWIILGTFVGLLVLVLNFSSNVTINGRALGDEMYALPAFWQRLTYIASFFHLLFGVLVIVLVTDEYSFRTLRQQVIDGLSRAELVLAKFYLVLGLGLFGVALLLLLGLYFGLLHSEDRAFSTIFGGVDALFYYLVQAVGYMSLAMLFGFIIRKSGLAIVAFVAYAKVVEPIIHFRLPDAVDKYMPMKVFGSLTPMPGQNLLDQLTASPTEVLSPAVAALPAIGYIILFNLLSYLILKLRDL
ncbi:ABC transporter permease [Pontibacter sp. CAU 1760]